MKSLKNSVSTSLKNSVSTSLKNSVSASLKKSLHLTSVLKTRLTHNTKMLLLTGGLGYIGSHVAVALLEQEIVIADNVSNSDSSMYDTLCQIRKAPTHWVNIDLTHESEVKDLFAQYDITDVIHLAGWKSVSESIQYPLAYYRNNVEGTLNLLQYCKHVRRFIFSSSATVYADGVCPLTEDSPVGGDSLNPYGRSKLIVEDILGDLAHSPHNKTTYTILRYFNPVGCHPQYPELREHPSGKPNNLMPYLVSVAQGLYPELNIFGSDYDTPDGTAQRDYIHVLDLAQAHVAALYSDHTSSVAIYNLGTSRPTSVLELVTTFQRVNSVLVPYVVTERRPGDKGVVYCDASKAQEALQWAPIRSLEDMCRDAYGN